VIVGVALPFGVPGVQLGLASPHSTLPFTIGNLVRSVIFTAFLSTHITLTPPIAVAFRAVWGIRVDKPAVDENAFFTASLPVS
jgi:hypothetical protein